MFLIRNFFSRSFLFEKFFVCDRLSQLEIEKTNLINFDVIKTCTKNFDSSTILGSGGFGTVYFGQLDDKKVAIKKLDIYDKDSSLLKQFENELLMLSQCKTHPNILPLLAVSLNEIPCLIYEYMPNGSLDRRLTCKVNFITTYSYKYLYRYRVYLICG